MTLKKNLILLFFVLAGIVIGSLISSVAAGIPVISWLAYSTDIGVSPHNPLFLDLKVVVISFGFEIRVTIAQIFAILASFFAHKAVAGRI